MKHCFHSLTKHSYGDSWNVTSYCCFCDKTDKHSYFASLPSGHGPRGTKMKPVIPDWYDGEEECPERE